MRCIIVVLILAICNSSFSQTGSEKYPQGYFQWPVPLKKEIVANMGELRPNHWHMGLDIRTAQKVNQLVNASAAGYIAHIGIRPQSFGRFIVINHPNGLSTLYGHLNTFYPALEEYVTAKQYEQESWAIELDFTPDQFPVKKGQFISYSGTTGGSQGPHVHFEIFDTKSTKRLNPLLFGFGFADNVAPGVVKLAMYDREKSVFAQSPQLYALKKTDSGYVIPKIPVIKTSSRKISFGIQAYDRLSGSTNADGIYGAALFVDEVPVVKFIIDSISYEETGYMNAQIDFRYKYNGGPFLQHLSRLPGDNGPVYKTINGDGVIELNDTLERLIRIDVDDAAGNQSVIRVRVQYDSSAEKMTSREYSEAALLPHQVNEISRTGFKLTMPTGCLYDTVHPVYFKNNSSGAFAVSSIHQVNDASVPVYRDFKVMIAPDRKFPFEWNEKILIQRTSRGTSTRKAGWEYNPSTGERWLTATFGDLGNFQAIADVTAPGLKELGKGDTINLSASKQIVFTPTDNFGIKNFRAELNGKWLRFTNDKSRNWIYIFDEQCPYGVHHLKVTVEDLAGNQTVKSWWFKRAPYTPPPPKAKKKRRR